MITLKRVSQEFIDNHPNLQEFDTKTEKICDFCEKHDVFDIFCVQTSPHSVIVWFCSESCMNLFILRGEAMF